MTNPNNPNQCPDRAHFQTLFLNYADAQSLALYLLMGATNWNATFQIRNQDDETIITKLQKTFGVVIQNGNDLDIAIKTIEKNYKSYTERFNDTKFQLHISALITAYKSLVQITPKTLSKNTKTMFFMEETTQALRNFTTALFKIEMFYTAECAKTAQKKGGECPFHNPLITILGDLPILSPFNAHFFYSISLNMWTCGNEARAPIDYFNQVTDNYTEVLSESGPVFDAWQVVLNDPVDLGDCYEIVATSLENNIENFKTLFKTSSIFFALNLDRCPATFDLDSNYQKFTSFCATMERMHAIYQSACLGNEKNCNEGEGSSHGPFPNFNDIHFIISSHTRIANLYATHMALIDIGPKLHIAGDKALDKAASFGNNLLSQTFGEKSDLGISVDNCTNNLKQIPSYLTTIVTSICNQVTSLRKVSTKQGADYYSTSHLTTLSSLLKNLSDSIGEMKTTLSNALYNQRINEK